MGPNTCTSLTPTHQDCRGARRSESWCSCSPGFHVNWSCWWHKRIRTHQRSMPSPYDILGWIQLWITVSIKYVILLREDFLVASKVSFGTHLLASKKAKGFRVCRTQFAVAERQADKTFKRQEGDLSLGILGKELANGFNQRGEIQTQVGMWQKWMRP